MITEEDYKEILRNFETGLSVSDLMSIRDSEGCLISSRQELWRAVASQYHSKDYLYDEIAEC